MQESKYSSRLEEHNIVKYKLPTGFSAKYTPDDYQEFVTFLHQVKKMDQEKLLLVSGT